MSGNLSVVAATIEAPQGPVLAGGPLQLSGRAPAGTPALDGRALRRAAARGPRPATPSPPGPTAATRSARRPSPARRTASRGPAGASPALTPAVTARIDVHVALHGRHLEVHAMPAPKGLKATLELYRRWRFRWAEQRTRKLDGGRHGALPAPARAEHLRARDAARAERRTRRSSRAAILRTRNGHTAPDPDAPAPRCPQARGTPGGHGMH